MKIGPDNSFTATQNEGKPGGRAVLKVSAAGMTVERFHKPDGTPETWLTITPSGAGNLSLKAGKVKDPNDKTKTLDSVEASVPGKDKKGKSVQVTHRFYEVPDPNGA